MLDKNMTFTPALQNLAVGVADQLSTDVVDIGAAKKLFEGYGRFPPKLCVGYTCTVAGAGSSIRARLVGADNAALALNPVILADSGVVKNQQTGADLAAGDVVIFEIPVTGQKVPKQFYGVIFTQGQAAQDGEATAYVGEEMQTNMTARKAAVP